jgi:hypothetical protein
MKNFLTSVLGADDVTQQAHGGPLRGGAALRHVGTNSRHRKTDCDFMTPSSLYLYPLGRVHHLYNGPRGQNQTNIPGEMPKFLGRFFNPILGSVKHLIY